MIIYFYHNKTKIGAKLLSSSEYMDFCLYGQINHIIVPEHMRDWNLQDLSLDIDIHYDLLD